MRPRITPSFVVAVLALVLAASGTGYAAGKITSKQIKNETVQSKDVKNGTLTGADVADGGLAGADLADGTVAGADVGDGSLTGADLADGSVGRGDLSRACAAGEIAAFGGCVRLASSGPSSYAAAVDDCNARGGRLPSTGELKWLSQRGDVVWANGNGTQYEFSGSWTSTAAFYALAFDKAFNTFGSDPAAQNFWHHCVTY